MMLTRTRSFAARLACACVFLACDSLGAAAAAMPVAADVDYPGVIDLHVDVTDVAHHVFRVHETIPVPGPGPLTLLYPRWLPGNHSTTGPIEQLAGLQVQTGDGARLEWQRDLDATYAFHLDVPAGVTQLHLVFDFVAPVSSDQGRVLVTPDLLDLQWEKALLYPAGHYSRRIRIDPSVTVPAGWSYATALDGAARDRDTVRFATVSLERLVDSPLFAGAHARRVMLDTDPKAPVALNIFADSNAELAANPQQIDIHKRLVREALALFGSRHFEHYDFLFAVSEHFDSIGLEHHQSTEVRMPTGYFTDWTGSTVSGRDLLAHEFVHSWNGKFRRPADLLTPSYEVPVGTSLLWVYEGMTEYWGVVLATRSGLWTPQFARDTLAQYAAAFDVGRAGRQWRSLQDTTRQPVILYRGKQSYPSWQREKDYYTEGLLLWLDVDTRIRELTRGRRSLDNFARAFFGVDNGRIAPLTYTFEDVVQGLNAVAPYDWSGLLRALLDGHGPGAPLDGLTRGGWRLTYAEEPSASTTSTDAANSVDSFLFSLGFAAEKSGKVTEVYWNSLAFNAGLARDMTVVAVNSRAYSAPLLREAIRAAQKDPGLRLELLVRDDDTFRTLTIDYHDGLRYPRLTRTPEARDRLAEILQPRAAAKTSDRTTAH